MVSYTSSSVPHNPTLRSAALNTVIVVPLLSKTIDSYSSKSFKALFEALSDINLEGETSLNNRYVDAAEITLVIPNSNLTPPGDWRYDDTPLRSHDWSVGCQRLLFVDGKRSVYAHDRIKAFSRDKTASSQYGDFVDLYPGRGTAAVIGVLNVKDCESDQDFVAAEKELEIWKQKFTPMLYSQQYWEEAFDSPIAPKHFVTKRMFVFDSFEEDCKVDLAKAENISELVSFPPTQSMNFHLSVVINDLAVNIFQNLEKRIRIIDDLSAEKYDRNRERSNKIEDVAKAVTAENILNSSFEMEDEDQTVDETVSTSKASLSSVKPTHSRSTSSGNRMGVGIPGGLKTLAASAGKALWKPSQSEKHEFTALPPIEHELQTPLDSNFDESQINSKDITMIFQRNEARRQKYAGDLALMAGSTVDAYDRYTQATLGSKKSQDPLWYAAALEGIASSFVAMADIGGGFGDAYLENNFQYPENIMTAALNIIDDGKESKPDKTKTTMPAAVYALLQEATEILSRHIKLASLYSEILLKTAWYVAELEELHVRCRWGEGFSGSVGDEDADGHLMTAALSGTSKRWVLTSVSNIDLSRLKEAGKLESVLCEKAVNQSRFFTELLHQSVSNIGIDSYTRAQIAGRCAKLCLRGVRVPNWGATDETLPVRFHLPRKAAFFTVVAAEAISQTSIDNAKVCAAGFWAAASHLYSKEANKFEGKQMYGWASLRATILHGLGVYGGDVASERAMETLLLLLGECAPASSITCSDEDENISTPDVSNEREITVLTSTDRIITLDLQRKQDHNLTKLPARSTFFRAGPSILQEQSKWVDGESVSFTILPLVEPSSVMVVSQGSDDIQFLKKAEDTYTITSPLICLNADVSKIDHRICAKFQNEFSAQLSKIREALPTLSTNDTYLEESQYLQTSISPLGVVSARIIKSESHMLLERIKSSGFSSKTGDSLATFFNPYATKKQETRGKNLVTPIAQGEERTIVVEFSNHLSIPLAIPQCRLVFDKSSYIDIDAPSLSFTVPPKSARYPVHFPFIIVSFEKQSRNGKEENIHTENQKFGSIAYNSFGLIGIHVTSFNRSFFLPFLFEPGADAESGVISQHSNRQIPEPMSLFKFEKKSVNKATKHSVKLEAVSAQPNLIVSFVSSSQPLEDNSTISVHLSDGEIFTIPAFRLENDFGPSGKGIMERLQIIGVGLPGLPEEILFDTDEQAKALEEQEDRLPDEGSGEDFDELMESDGLPPLKMKCIAEGLSLQSVNDRNKSLGEGSILSFQVAATHDMGNMGKKLANGGKVRIRFRYRGPSPAPGIEIWRKREMNLNIVRVKGPRISSLTFRTDLSWGSPYSDLCWALSHNRSHQVKVAEDDMSTSVSVSEDFAVKDESLTSDLVQNDERYDVLNQVGTSQGVFIAKDDIVVLMAVANETNSSIVLSNRAGQVGGFESSPMETVTVSSGVSVKIPVVIPRINCIDENGNIADFASELIQLTALRWKSEEGIAPDGSKKEKRQGRIRIPSRCLREMINDHPSFVTRICKPPLIIHLEVGENREIEPTMPLELSVGSPLNLLLKVQLNNWVPKVALNGSIIVLEFCCARLNSGINANTFAKENENAYVWCGQTKKGFSFFKNDVLSHRARVCFVSPGDYVVSGCAKIRRNDKEEVWFAPMYQSIKIPKMD